METMTFSTTARAGGQAAIAVTGISTADELHMIENTVDPGDTVSEALAITQADIEAFYIYSDKAVTVTPFAGATATGDGPFDLAAKSMVDWSTADLHTNPIQDNFDSLHIHNASDTDTATVKIAFLVNAAS